jgi:hypothetical protein
MAGKKTRVAKQTLDEALRRPPPNPQGQPKSQSSGPEKSAPGAEDARQAAAQKAAHQAETLRQGLFASLMASALDLDNLFGSPAYKIYLERLQEDAGNSPDPIERMLLEQLALAHFRIGQLHVSAGRAQAPETAKMYNSVAARMLGEFRRTALALRVYQSRVRDDKTEANAASMKLYKQAQ